ncbi:MAG: hypothetical protein Q9167_000894 [Letrouitia subvulpina]
MFEAFYSIVVITSIAVAATASAVSTKFGAFSRVGGIIGTSVSAAFLIILGILNMYILYKLVLQMNKLIDSSPESERRFEIRAVTVVVAVVVGVIQLLNLILSVAEPTGKFWSGVAVAGDHFDVIGELLMCVPFRQADQDEGGAICGSFIVFGGLSVLCYKPWRRRIDRVRQTRCGSEAIDRENEDNLPSV